MKFNIVPYQSVGALVFGMTIQAVQQVLGQVDRIVKTDDDISEVYNFSLDILAQIQTSTNQLIEVGFGKRAKNVTLGNLSFFDTPSKDVVLALCHLDGSPLYTSGSLLFLKLGITLTGFLDKDVDADKAVSFFHQGGADQVIPIMKPFKF